MTTVQSPDLKVGQIVKTTKVFTRDEVNEFTVLTFDQNKLHTDEAYARSQGFVGCIVPGAFIGSIVAGVIGSELPGNGTVAGSMNMSFKAPVYVGQEVTVKVVVTKVDDSEGAEFAILHFSCATDRLVLEGKAMCRLPQTGS